MAILTNQDFSIEFSVDYYYFLAQQGIEEYHYSCTVKHLDLPFIYTIYQNKRSEIIDFELDDSKLSDMFVYALKNQTEGYLPMTSEGSFDITLTPYLDSWQIKLEIGTLYFERPDDENFSTKFEMPITRQALTEFTQALKKEETAIHQKYAKISNSTP